MTKVQDISARDRWPTIYRIVKKSFPVALGAFGICGIAWIVLGILFNGVPSNSDVKITVVNGIQTTITTSTENLLASQLMAILMWPALIAGFWLYFALIMALPSRLNMLGGEEVQQKE